MNPFRKLMSKRLTLSLLGVSLSTGGLLFWENIDHPSLSISAQAQASAPESPPIETVSTPGSLALAQHLQKIGAKMYGAYWCPHCHSQKERFGKEAVSQILLAPTAPVYIECSPEGRTASQAQVCQQAGITAYPTWIIEGEKYEGDLSLQQLAELSGYQGPPDF